MGLLLLLAACRSSWAELKELRDMEGARRGGHDSPLRPRCRRYYHCLSAFLCHVQKRLGKDSTGVESHGSASPSCLYCTSPVGRYNLLQKSGQSHAVHPPTTLYVSLLTVRLLRRKGAANPHPGSASHHATDARLHRYRAIICRLLDRLEVC